MSLLGGILGLVGFVAGVVAQEWWRHGRARRRADIEFGKRCDRFNAACEILLRDLERPAR